MTPHLSIIVVIAALAVFLILAAALKYAVADYFVRTRFLMSAFFLFIVFTLSVSFWRYAAASLVYSAPAALIGIAAGYLVGVRGSQERLRRMGIERYLSHFAHVDIGHEGMQWWSLINFYSIMGALLLINAVGLSDVIFAGRKDWALLACALGAFLIGSIVPYLIHLWSLNTKNASPQAPRMTEGGEQASL